MNETAVLLAVNHFDICWVLPLVYLCLRIKDIEAFQCSSSLVQWTLVQPMRARTRDECNLLPGVAELEERLNERGIGCVSHDVVLQVCV